MAPGVHCIDGDGNAAQMTSEDVLVVAPYDAHVSRLAERLVCTGASVGTVDKFQRQEAPVVIYSMATSRAEDAPRGMEFLYNLNRLKVATSRALQGGSFAPARLDQLLDHLTSNLPQKSP
jgi:superfamily I DNA and/or RNA helicase